MDQTIPFESKLYFVFLGILLLARGSDFLSTWLATPNLLLEANPIAKRLGWRGGMVVNLVMCALFAAWPLPAIVVSTTSFLVAARNFQSAWLMRSMGEYSYRNWMAARISEGAFGIYMICLVAQSLLVALVGGALMLFSGEQLIPFGIGAGILTYALAVFIFTALSVYRLRKSG
ncbi:MAG TPA: hypothetical protein VEH27_09235 [Methylomirabilota bacterium]|nr:hypothetical protein [Methylomirabilota bacterium]